MITWSKVHTRIIIIIIGIYYITWWEKWLMEFFYIRIELVRLVRTLNGVNQSALNFNLCAIVRHVKQKSNDISCWRVIKCLFVLVSFFFFTPPPPLEYYFLSSIRKRVCLLIFHSYRTRKEKFYMGGAVSAGQDNDELVDNLCYDDYITSLNVETAFRMVDRADYMQFGEKEDHLEAYEDHAWRRGTLHLSAPCIYSRALEALELKPGLSFLNIGSGTGYFSTMAGLLLGPYGTNHGVEICEENVEFANERVAKFQSCSSWYDPAKFCEPLFVLGNGLQLGAGNMQYDRIYCGAGCSTEHTHLFKNLLKVGGILVVPREGQVCMCVCVCVCVCVCCMRACVYVIFDLFTFHKWWDVMYAVGGCQMWEATGMDSVYCTS